LIITAHGSRRKESNQELEMLVKRICKKSSLKSYSNVDHAFLQIASPLLKDKILEKIEKGAKQIVIFPFFIGSGSHILIDIPTLVNQFKQEYPQVELMITRHLGMLESIEDAIVNEVETL